LIRRLNDWKENEIGGYEVFLHDFDKMEKTSDDLYALPAFPQTWDTQPIRSIYPNIFDWLNLQNLTRNVLIGFMVLVAVINLITCLIILVLERIRMVGRIKSSWRNRLDGAKNISATFNYYHTDRNFLWRHLRTWIIISSKSYRVYKTERRSILYE
jgi:hypothetical protein